MKNKFSLYNNTIQRALTKDKDKFGGEKMRKSKLMMGILVASMGLLGTGYAAFTQTTVLNGTANVGNLTLDTELDTEKILVHYNTAMSGDIDDYAPEDAAENDYIRNSNYHFGETEDDTSETYTLRLNRLVPGKTFMVPIEVNNTGDVAASLKDIEVIVGGKAGSKIRTLVQYVDEGGNVLFQKGKVNLNGNGAAEQITMETPIKPNQKGRILCFIRLDDQTGNEFEGLGSTVTFKTSFEQYIPSDTDVSETAVDEVEAQ